MSENNPVPQVQGDDLLFLAAHKMIENKIMEWVFTELWLGVVGGRGGVGEPIPA